MMSELHKLRRSSIAIPRTLSSEGGDLTRPINLLSKEDEERKKLTDIHQKMTSKDESRAAVSPETLV